MNLRKRKRLVCGIGINDANYSVNKRSGNGRESCPIYRVWANMLIRCYSKKYKDNHQTYMDCTVCSEWLTFSNFKAWVERQDWKGKHIDKDILLFGNKSYSPETCVFVTAMTNTFITDSTSARGEHKIGARKCKNSNNFYAQCCNPFSGKREYLGAFKSDTEAHEAWRNRKHELACQLAELQTDERVANALRTRYL